MPLVMVDAAETKVDVSMDEDAVDGVGGEFDEVEEYTAKEVVDESAAHIKMVLTYQMSPVTFKKQSWPHSQKIQKNDKRGSGMY